MRIVDDISGLRAVPPRVGTDDINKETNAKQALFQPATLYQPALQNTAMWKIGVATSAQPSIGAAALAPPPNGTISLPNVDAMPVFVQQSQGAGASGTTTLSEIMSYFGKPKSQAEIDGAIRRTDIELAFSPDDLIDYARDQGLKAEGYNNGSWSDVKSMINAGHPVQARLNDGDFINITGYGTDPASGQEFVLFHDPHSGTEQQMSVSDFEKKWGPADDGLIHVDGYKNYFIAYGDHWANLPPGRDDGIEGTQGYQNGVANLANGIDRIIHPDNWGGFVHGIFETVGGIPQSLGSYFGAGLQAGGNWLNGAVEGIPVLENVAQPIGDLVNGIGAGIGDVFNGVGETFDDFGGAIEELSHGHWDAFTDRMADAAMDIGGGVVDAATDALGAVGDAIGDIFSGW